jgi:hypothetical protein
MPEIHFRWWFFNKRTVVLFWKNHQLGKITITWEMCGLFSLFSQLQQQNTTNVTDEHQHSFLPRTSPKTSEVGRSATFDVKVFWCQASACSSWDVLRVSDGNLLCIYIYMYPYIYVYT